MRSRTREETAIRLGGARIVATVVQTAWCEAGPQGLAAWASKRPIRLRVETSEGAWVVDLEG